MEFIDNSCIFKIDTTQHSQRLATLYLSKLSWNYSAGCVDLDSA